MEEEELEPYLSEQDFYSSDYKKAREKIRVLCNKRVHDALHSIPQEPIETYQHRLEESIKDISYIAMKNNFIRENVYKLLDTTLTERWKSSSEELLNRPIITFSDYIRERDEKRKIKGN